MKNFLQITAEHYKDGLAKKLFLFPTKRSMFAFRKEAEIVNGGPVEHLATITASEFYHRLSGKNPSDRIELLMVLYDCYKELNPAAEPLDEFIFWGDVILQDFNDVDRAMADSRSVYLSVDAYKDLQDYGESLTETQKKALSTYLGSFENENAAEGGVKAHMKRIWNILGPLYESFKSATAAKGLSTEGGLLREVACDSFPLETRIREVTGKDKIVFVGLGSLNACEKALLGRLRDINLAEFVWDCSDPRILADTNLAGRAMEENMKAFPQAFAFGEDLTGRKTVNVIPVPSNVGQVSHVKDILSAMGAEEGRDTVIVLPDASLAPSLLRALPEKALKGINVTMGRKVAGTPLDLLMKAVVNLHVNAKTAPDGTVRYPFNDVLAVFDSPLFRNALDDEDRARTEAVRGNVMMNVKAEDLTVADRPSLLNTVFAPAGFDMTAADADNSHSFGQRLLAVIEGVKVEKESDGTDWQAPFVDAWEKCLKKTMEYRLPVAPVTFVKVLMKMISGQSIPYEMGENGALQVMGPLETRALDFKNVVILSCNEGTFPAPAGNATSLIPYSIRRAFGLPVQEDTDISWAYYFYRLIQRPEQIWVLYDSRTEKTRQGEESRYIKQLRHVHGDNVVTHTVKGSAAVPHVMGDIPKPADIRQKLQGEVLSATALQRYLFCPAKFYFHNIEHLYPRQEMNGSLDAAMTGNVYHATMQAVYLGETALDPNFDMDAASIAKAVAEGTLKPLGTVSRYYILERLANPEALRAKIHSLILLEENAETVEGKDLITEEVILRYVIRTLENDLLAMDEAETDEMEILGLEKRLRLNIGGLTFSGTLDRVDSVDGRTVRIVDYKTGKVTDDDIFISDNNAKDVVEKLFGESNKDRPKIALQLYLYDRMARTLRSVNGRPVENVIMAPGKLFSEREMRSADSPVFRSLMDEKVDKMLAEMLDQQIPFRRTCDPETCALCEFRTLCGR